MVLVANKSDLKADRVISTQDGEELAKILKVQQIYMTMYVTQGFIQRGGGNSPLDLSFPPP